MTETTLEQRGETNSGSHWVRRTLRSRFVSCCSALWAWRSRASSPRAFPSSAPLSRNSSPIAPVSRCASTTCISPGISTAPARCSRASSSPIPQRGRVRVVAPELRVEFDTWDYPAPPAVLARSRHAVVAGHRDHRRPVDRRCSVAAASRAAASRIAVCAAEDEAALVRRFTAWAELMPNGRIEVEGARVHLLRRGDRAARTTASR